MTSRVAIIGAGPCGLGQMRAFATARDRGEAIPEVVCFEKQDDWGGLWNYTWRTGLDEYGEAVHSSMYRYLWSNGPKECLEFADYSFEEHFGKPIPSFPPRSTLAHYIRGRGEKSNVRDWVRFATAARWVTWVESEAKFSVSTEDLRTHTLATEMFDNVIVATGHFSVPNVPRFDGIESFPGRVMHSHDFRSADEFTGKHLVVVGASYSAEDIALQCHKYGAASVTLCYRTNAMGFKWPEGMDERPLMTRVEGATVHFKDGSTKQADAIILCTGYQHHFPFMDDPLKLRTHNRMYPPGLFKGVAWSDNPRLHYLGMQDQFYTFSMFDVQAWWARDACMGKIALPSKAAMEAHNAEWVKREEALPDAFAMIDFQADHVKEMMQDTDYPHFDIELTVQEFKEWEHDKEASI
ncbi:MAG: flavin-containing monooxygenase, partial [Gammaproteobacteria bacterium]